MIIPNREKALQRILDSIPQEMEEKYFVCCEIEINYEDMLEISYFTY